MCSSRFAILSVVAGALALAACGQLPRPFASDPDEPSPPDLLRPADGAGVVVDASRCAGDSAAALNEAVIAALVRHEVPAAGTGGNRGSMRLVCAESGGGATLRWALDGADGAPLGAFEQALSDFDPAADGGLAPLADDAAVRVLWLLGRNVPLPPSAVRPALVVTPIAGAPGNGAVALGRAMTKALEWRGATLALEPGENTLLVLGSVALSDAAAGSQLVEITWEVIRPDGARLGVVSQKNTVPEGSLDGKWGTIAAAIASSAAQGVVDLLDRTIPR